MSDALFIPAFIAGILTFFAPCTFPLIPAYLGVISGVSPKNLSSAKTADRVSLVRNALLFVLGFSSIFIVFGTAVAWGGQFLFPYRAWLERLAGLFIIVFGLSLVGVFHLPFFRAATNLRASVPGLRAPSRALNSLFVGAAFGTGWTPCVGPILGAVLTLAATTATLVRGAALLAVFSLGLAIPFLLVALAIGSATRYLPRVTKYLGAINVVGAAFLIGLGVLLLTNRVELLVQYGYRLFDFVNYDRIINHL